MIQCAVVIIQVCHSLAFLLLSISKETVIERGPINSYLQKKLATNDMLEATFSTFPPKHFKHHRRSMTATLEQWG